MQLRVKNPSMSIQVLEIQETQQIYQKLNEVTQREKASQTKI